jgi:Flp pilus assembly protein TadD
MAGCAGTGPAALLAGEPAATQTAAATAPGDFRSELQKATEYWGNTYAKNPQDAQSALNYARNLKALGEKQKALAVLQQASQANPAHRGINGEYGRLALEFDQVSAAQKLLELADDPANPDWRVVSARGTVLAKQGRYRDAIALYERALTLAPSQPSVLNNLALAHAMEGNPEKAEPLLKLASANGSHDARVSQNLALVLSLQGKYDEAKLASGGNLPADTVASNVDYMRRMVKLEPKPLAPAAAVAQAKPNAPEKTAEAVKAPAKAAAAAKVIATAKANAAKATATKTAAAKTKPELKGATAEARGAGMSADWATQVAEAPPAAR